MGHSERSSSIPGPLAPRTSPAGSADSPPTAGPAEGALHQPRGSAAGVGVLGWGSWGWAALYLGPDSQLAEQPVKRGRRRGRKLEFGDVSVSLAQERKDRQEGGTGSLGLSVEDRGGGWRGGELGGRLRAPGTHSTSGVRVRAVAAPRGGREPGRPRRSSRRLTSEPPPGPVPGWLNPPLTVPQRSSPEEALAGFGTQQVLQVTV